MLFQPKGNATISGIKVRRGKGDDSSVSVEVRFQAADVAADAAAGAITAKDVAEVEAAFFQPLSVDAERSSRFLGLAAVQSACAWENKHRIKIQGFRPVRCSRVGSIHLVPRGHCRFDVEFSVVIEQPGDGFIEQLAQFLNRSRSFELEQDQELALEGGGAGGTAPPASAKLKEVKPKPAPKLAAKPAPKKPAAKKPAPKKKPAAAESTESK